MKDNVKKETYTGFNAALAQFMNEPAPASIIYSPNDNLCSFMAGIGSKLPKGFQTLIYKSAVAE